LNTQEYTSSRVTRWFFPSEDIDNQAKKFEPLIHDAGNNRLTSSPWTTDLGMLARILLTDQIPRQAFRGTDAAFAYDDVAVSLASKALDDEMDARLPGAMRIFVTLPLIHSEDVALHAKAEESAEKLISDYPNVDAFSENQRQVKEHKSVVDRCRTASPPKSCLLVKKCQRGSMLRVQVRTIPTQKQGSRTQEHRGGGGVARS